MNLISVERTEEFTKITLNRAEKRNALSMVLLEQICTAIQETENTPGQRAILITGNGPVFCAGMDLEEAADLKNLDPLTHLIAKTLTAIHTSSLITVAAVNGTAVAGGAGIMSACDFVIASENTKIGYPEIQRDLVPAQVSTLLVRQVSWRIVRELLLFGELIDAKRALEIGLINKIVPSEELVQTAIGWVEKVIKFNFEVIGATKGLLGKLEPGNFEEQLRMAVDVHKQARLSKSTKEGLETFFKKSSVVYHGVRFDVRRCEYKTRNDKTAYYEAIAHPGAVVILPLMDDGSIVMIRNQRIAVGQTLWELPAGTLELQEAPEATAYRELIEETGYQAKTMELLTTFYSTPGISNEVMHVYVARGLNFVGQNLDAGEEILPVVLSQSKIMTMIQTGEIKDAKTLTTLLYFANTHVTR